MADSGNMAATQGSPAGGRPGRASAAEIAQFDAIAAQWWDPRGPMAALHAMNPLRIAWITKRLPPRSRVLDVGCGAGLASEALARCGHSVLGLDAAPQTLAAARSHAAGQDLALDYRLGVTSDLVREPARFDAVVALEVIEHVPDQAGFLRDLAALLAPSGTLIVSTVNRTVKSMLVAKLGAEYVARLLPVGTHDWRRFVPPGALASAARTAGLEVSATAGMSYDPLRRRWRLSHDLSINYIAALIHRR